MTDLLNSMLHLELVNISRNKKEETLCGDCFQMFGTPEHRVVAMSDGLGSGVRANILATLTATILGTLLKQKVPLEECVDTVASTLPISKEHGLAYATFTAVEIEGDVAYLVEYDNPPVMVFRNGKPFRYPYSVRFVGDKEIHESRLTLQSGDVIVLMSDGVTHSGIGKGHDFGWSIGEIQNFLMENHFEILSAAEIGAIIQKKCLELCGGVNDDDTTTTVLRMTHRSIVNLMIGPPKNKKDDKKVLRLFFGKSGRHIVCGGSTSKMVSRYLDKPIQVLQNSGNSEVPDMAVIEGVDMVTEGVITMKRVYELCTAAIADPMKVLELNSQTDPASQMAKLLMKEATDVNIYFGMAANNAHDELGIGFDKKLKLIQQIDECLTSIGKRVNISYC